MDNSARKDQTIWIDEAYPDAVRIIDQTKLPFHYEEFTVDSVDSMAHAIEAMLVRGAGLIGVAAGWGMYLAAIETRDMAALDADEYLRSSAKKLNATRPTAANLGWAVDRQLNHLLGIDDDDARVTAAQQLAQEIMDDDIESCRRIGEFGLALISDLHARLNRRINILTHCNAGWLAFVKHGSATAPIYAAHNDSIPVHVFVGESRPRNQGPMTAWEMRNAGIEHTYVVDSAVGHLIQRGEVDIIFTGADRVTMCGDVANKIGTYLRALVAREHGVPFYVNFPSSTLDPFSREGVTDIEIEERSPFEVEHVMSEVEGKSTMARVLGKGSRARNPAFDVTPRKLITGLISERGICHANPQALAKLFPEHVAKAGASNG